MKLKIYPSLMCLDWLRAGESLAELEAAGVDGLHFDIMDGSFVPNFALGADAVRTVRKVSSLPLDAHLMCWQPERHVVAFAKAGADIISVHAEATTHLPRTLDLIRSVGAKPAVALNPATSLETLKYVLDQLDMVMLMMVSPGYAGQKLIPSTLDKLSELREILERNKPGTDIEVDGNVSFERAPEMVKRGATVLVAGTSSVFAPGLSSAAGVARLRESCASA